MFQSKSGCQNFCLEVLLCFLCCQGFWAKPHMCIILAACANQIMRTQVCSCVCMILLRNPNHSSSNFVSYFTCNASVLDPLYIYIYIYVVLSLYSIVCLFVFLSHVRIRIYLSFLYFNAMNVHSHVHALMPQVLSCYKVSEVSHAFVCTCIFL